MCLPLSVEGKIKWNDVWKAGLPWWFRWERIWLQCGRSGIDPCIMTIPWRREWLLIPVFLPEDSRDREAWRATVHAVTKSQKQLSDFHFGKHLAHCPGEQSLQQRTSFVSTVPFDFSLPENIGKVYFLRSFALRWKELNSFKEMKCYFQAEELKS